MAATVLYAAMKYDYGKPERGLSFEHYSFYETFRQMGWEIIYFDFGTLYQEIGRSRMNRRLWEIVRAEKPQLMFTFLFEEELDKATVRRISEEAETVTLNWFADDHWRFDSFSRYWAPCFNWVVTTAQSALPKYAALGYQNVIKSQWGFNPALFRRLNLPPTYDVTFIGQPHGNRQEVVDTLRKAGVEVSVWGYGWEAGRLTEHQMVEVMCRSRICLNLPNASTGGVAMPMFRVGSPLRKAVGRLMDRAGFLRRIKNQLRDRLASGKTLLPLPEQIKGRHFEIAGCGRFQLSGRAENLEDYFVPGEEIVTFDDTGDLIEKTRYYLAREEERERIAAAGHVRAVSCHTYQHRFREVFTRIGLSTP